MAVPEQISRIISESGNSFHAKVARWLAGDGWHIRVSPYYMDQSQNKAREIDLVAEKSWAIRDAFNHWHGDVVVRLFVECKFVPGHSVFWLADKDVDAAMRLVCKQDGGFRPDNMYTKKHHYLSESARVAKVFASSKTQEQDPFFKALNQVLNAQVSMQHEPASTLDRARVKKVAVLNYPVIICSSFSSIYAADFFGDTEPTPVGDNFQLEVQYAYTDKGGNSRDDYFLIDIVDFNQLTKLSAGLEVDAKTACFMLEP